MRLQRACGCCRCVAAPRTRTAQAGSAGRQAGSAGRQRPPHLRRLQRRAEARVCILRVRARGVQRGQQQVRGRGGLRLQAANVGVNQHYSCHLQLLSARRPARSAAGTRARRTVQRGMPRAAWCSTVQHGAARRRGHGQRSVLCSAAGRSTVQRGAGRAALRVPRHAVRTRSTHSSSSTHPAPHLQRAQRAAHALGAHARPLHVQHCALRHRAQRLVRGLHRHIGAL